MVTADVPTTLSGYQLGEQLYTSSRTLVYRAVRSADQQPVILKLLRNSTPTFSDLVQFRNQYTIVQHLNIPSVIQTYSLEPCGNGYVLVMEDFDGVSLAKFFYGQPLDLSTFLAIALQLAESLHALYQHRIIHKDLKPDNILIHPQSQQVKLIDFSIATLLPREMQEIQNPNVLEGTLAYLSPEQTGRMNRGIDYRSDFYALGVTLYELLTGQLPFQTDDPMELVHCHLARVAVPVHQVNRNVPVMVSHIVAKLMAKNAEERYQSALGLQHDLQQCWNQLQTTGTIASFDLATRDVCDRFLIPEKLYGREPDVQRLLDAFECVAQGSTELMLVAGFSGIGKTAVVNEVHKPIIRQRGYFIKGKFDQFNRNIPFSAFVQALRDLMGQLLMESDDQLAQWKARILTALGDNGQVIIDVVPELEVVLGSQPAVPDVSGSEAQNRFHHLLQQFIQVFATAEHPLVIFLDDLQWADLVSLGLMERLVRQQDCGFLLLIGAYRDNEVSATHPLMLTVDKLHKADISIHTLTLPPLQQTYINSLIADTLSCSAVAAMPLTQLVYQKAQGNPFFTAQLLKSLHTDGLIEFNQETQQWQSDMTRIKSLVLSDDVVEFMTQQLQKLPVACQDLLKLAACIGNQFDLTTLATVCEETATHVATYLWPALQEGFISPQNEIYKFFQAGTVAKNQKPEEFSFLNTDSCSYRFMHDRIQQAAYSLIAEDKRQVTHLQMGQLLLHQATASERNERLFEIVNHLNVGRSLLAASQEQEELAELNLMAGRKAKAATAYGAAVDYLTTGISLLPSDAWERHYDLTLAIHTDVAEVAYLNTDFEQMEQWATLVLHHAKTLLDTIPVQQTRLMGAKAQGRLLDSLQIGLQLLRSLGVEFPAQPTQEDMGQAFGATRQLWQTPLSLLDLPAMTEPHYRATMQILAAMVSCAYLTNPNLMVLVIFKQVELSIHYGNCQASICGYFDYGLILCGVIGDIPSGYDFGQLALRLLEKLQATSLKSRAWYVVYTYIHHWKAPLQESLPCLQEAYQSGLETGDIEMVGLNAAAYCYYGYHAGRELIGFADEMDAYRQNIHQYKQTTPIHFLEIYQQTVLNLLGCTEVPQCLTGKIFNQEQLLPQLQATNHRSALFLFHFNQMVLDYLFGEYQQAAQQSILAEQYLDGGIGTFMVPLYFFYDSLVQLALYHSTSEEERHQLLERIAIHQDKLQKWATLAPFNHQHRWELFEAERQAVLGDRMAAIEHYDRAIVSAHKNGFIQDEALANEQAAKFYLNWGKEKVAAGYLQEAYYSYARWGAKAKVKDLETRYSHLLRPILQQASQPLTVLETLATIVAPKLSSHAATDLHSSSSLNTSINRALDFTTILKASQKLSGTIQLDDLLHQLTQIILQNSGGDRCAIIRPNRVGEWRVEAIATPDKTELCSEPLDDNVNLPVKLIHYVKNTQEVVVIDNLKTDLPVIDDYLMQWQPKSILCLPILHQGHLIGILYLKNRAASGVFTSDRILILNFLCTQAAISLENADLYSQEQEKIKQLKEKNHLLAFQSTISHIAARSDSLSVMLQQFCQTIVDYLEAAFARIWLLNPAENILELNASAGLYTHLNGAHQYVPVGQFKIGLIAHEKVPHLTNDVINDPRVGNHEWARQQGMVAFAGHPLMIGDELLGVVAMFARTPLSPSTLTSLKVVATEISLGIQRKLLEASVEQKATVLEQALQDLQQTQLKMVQSEKMASLGNLVAGVAHEINNPVGFLNGSINNAKDYVQDLLNHLALYQHHHPNPAAPVQDHAEDIDLEFLGQDLPKLLDSMTGATDRIKSISISLRTFSRADTEYKVSADLHEGIDSTLLILKYRLKANQHRPAIQVIQDYGELPLVECFPGQLNQVFMNILANAIDMFDEMTQFCSFAELKNNPQIITVQTAVLTDQSAIEIRIRDNGKGMTEEVKGKIFDHLFTTKGVGKGTGLGLAIARQIITEKHDGTITVTSTSGEGTEFIIRLPMT